MLENKATAPSEIQMKLSAVREAMSREGLAGIRLRGVDWFSWITAGGSSVVILTSEIGIAEVLITRDEAWILTDAIEAGRLNAEEVASPALQITEFPWADARAAEKFVAERTRGGPVASDRPASGEKTLPAEMLAAKRRLLPQEVLRYQELGKDSAEAMTDALSAARPDWSEYDLAAEGSRQLWKRGIHPTLTLVGGDHRVASFRHPTATAEKLGRRAMLVFCARRHGLYANLTRFIYFEKPTPAELRLISDVSRIEAAALNRSRPGTPLSEVYSTLADAYSRFGHSGEILKHHQGGTTGYLSREVVARPQTPEQIEDFTALAWNPSLPGAKIEDTVITSGEGIEILTVDRRWPTTEVEGRRRPDIWVRA